MLADRFELSGLFGVDFILDGDQVWTLEVNPRYTASVEIVERATGIHAIAAPRGRDCQRMRLSTSLQAPRPRSPILVARQSNLFAKRDIVISEAFAEMALAEALRTALADAGRRLARRHANRSRPADPHGLCRRRDCRRSGATIATAASTELEQQIYAKRGAIVRLGIISDTHGHVELTRPAVRMFESLDVDAVLHCGDIGSLAVVELFAAWPTHFVFGNCDDELDEFAAAIRSRRPDVPRPVRRS